jgi:hypothetical protein
MDYEQKYNNLIQSFKEFFIEIHENDEDKKYFQGAKDEDIISYVYDYLEEAIKPPNKQMMALQFEVMRKAFQK